MHVCICRMAFLLFAGVQQIVQLAAWQYFILSKQCNGAKFALQLMVCCMLYNTAAQQY